MLRMENCSWTGVSSKSRGWVWNYRFNVNKSDGDEYLGGVGDGEQTRWLMSVYLYEKP